MKNLNTEFKVGLFSIVALLTTGYMFFVLSPDSFESTSSKEYYTILDNAGGIIPKTHVKTNGVTVGKVKAVELQVNRTRVTMEVDEKVKIPTGSKVELRTRGLLGDKWIEIVRVQDSGEYLDDDGYLPLNDDQIDVQQLMTLIGSIAKDVKLVTSSFSAALGGERGERTVANILADLQEIAANTKGIVSENREDLRTILDNLKTTTKDLKAILGDNRDDINLIVDNVKGSTEDLKVFASNAKDLVTGENQEKLDRILASFDQTMTDVEKTAKSVALVSDRIEKGEGTIGKLVNDDSVISELQGAILDIRDVLKPATKLQVQVDYHGEYKPDANGGHFFNVVFKTRPDKYYLLGFTDAGESIQETKIQTNDNGGDPNLAYTTTRIVEKKALRFNAQFAKRWHFAQVRFGLFESTGGIATDLYAWRDRLKFTLEAFDWDNDFTIRRTAHLKSYVSILFFSHIYAMAGIDDPTQRFVDDNGKLAEKQLDNWFLGAGLTFNDDDLKAIFGTAALAL